MKKWTENVNRETYNFAQPHLIVKD